MKKIDELLSREMTRKQFLLTIFAGMVSIFGLSSIIGLLTQSSSGNDEPAGYGMKNYGP